MLFLVCLVPRMSLPADKPKLVAATEMSAAVAGGCRLSCVQSPIPGCITLPMPVTAAYSIVNPHASHVATNCFGLFPIVSS